MTIINEEINTISDITNYVKIVEQDWLMSNKHKKEFFMPQPIKSSSMKICFIGEYKNYINSEYNITKTLINTKSFTIDNNKYEYAIQLYYKYNSNNDCMQNKEVVSLYYVNKSNDLIHIIRNW